MAEMDAMVTDTPLGRPRKVSSKEGRPLPSEKGRPHQMHRPGTGPVKVWDRKTAPVDLVEGPSIATGYFCKDRMIDDARVRSGCPGRALTT
jgi:hypothetical protein